MGSSSRTEYDDRDPRDWRRPAELARVHGVTRATVWRWARDKGIVDVRRLAPRVGVQMRIRDDPRES